MKLNGSNVIRILAATALLVILAVASIMATTTTRAWGGVPVFLPPAPLPPGNEQGWRLGDPVTYENLTIFPVLAARDANTSGFATLDEALASGDAIITEQGSYLRRTRDGAQQPVYSGAQVNQLVLVNRGKRPLLLLAGEVVSGGKQDRIIGKDRIVPVGAPPLPLDVFCVEHGRWTGGSDKFAAANTMVHPSVREKAAVDQDQGQVWAAVRSGTTSSQTVVVDGASSTAAGGAKTTTGSGTAASAAARPRVPVTTIETQMATVAPTQSYRKIYQSPAVGASVEDFVNEVERRFARARRELKGERVVGVIVAYGSEVAWSDIFASSELFDVYWPKLLRSYAVEAVTRPVMREAASLADAHDFLRPASGHIREETEPGVYRWRERSEGRRSEIELEALEPKPLTLHWMKVLRAS
jgi:hypothetical protein